MQPLAYARGSERLLITRVLIPSRDRKGAALYTRKQILRRKLASVKLSHSGLIQTLNVMPAVAAGVTDGLWEVSEVIRLLEEGKALWLWSRNKNRERRETGVTEVKKIATKPTARRNVLLTIN